MQMLQKKCENKNRECESCSSKNQQILNWINLTWTFAFDQAAFNARTVILHQSVQIQNKQVSSWTSWNRCKGVRTHSTKLFQDSIRKTTKTFTCYDDRHSIQYIMLFHYLLSCYLQIIYNIFSKTHKYIHHSSRLFSCPGPTDSSPWTSSSQNTSTTETGNCTT